MSKKKYITKQGDMFDSIAYNELGSESFTDALMNANTDYHKAYIFSAGIELTLPDVSNIVPNEDLPPWRRV